MDEREIAALAPPPPTGGVAATKVHALERNRTRILASAGLSSIH